MTWKKHLVPGALAACLVLAVAMAVLKPIPHGHRYDLAVKLSAALLVFWFLFERRPGLVLKRGVLAVALLAGIGLGIGEIAVINPRSEIVRVYADVFADIDSGRNPYTSGNIFHYAEFYKPVYGNFNYPPMEIYPYYAAYRLTGRWDSTVMTSVFILLQGLVCVIFLATFPAVKREYLVPFFGLFLFTEIITNVAMTFLVTALILLAIKKNREDPRPLRRLLVAVLFGVGLMTKFLVIPFIAAYYWSGFDARKPRSAGPIVLDAGVALATAALVAAPFGVAAVFKNTVLFNLVLKDRAAFTTFYPNILSGPMTLAGIERFYPAAALAILAAAILASPRLGRVTALMTAGTVFLFVTATPEPQYIPVMLYLTLFGVFLKLEAAERGILRRPPAAEAAPA